MFLAEGQGEGRDLEPALLYTYFFLFLVFHVKATYRSEMSGAFSSLNLLPS